MPEELIEKIRAQEALIAESVMKAVTDSLPQEIQMPSDCTIVMGLEYRDGKLIKIASALNASLDDKFEDVTDIPDVTDVTDENVTTEDDPEDIGEHTRAKSIGFTVKFGDGTIIRESSAQQTMIEALRHIGLDRASAFREEMFIGFPLIGKVQRTVGGSVWQKEVDGWWIYIRIPNKRKIACLKGVAKMLNVNMEIIPDKE